MAGTRAAVAAVALFLVLVCLCGLLAACFSGAPPLFLVFGGGSSCRRASPRSFRRNCGALRSRSPSPGRAGPPTAACLRARKSKNLVIDTLNLTHHYIRTHPREGRAPDARLRQDDVFEAIASMSTSLRPTFPGRLIFVVKGPETARSPAAAEDERAAYQAAACKLGVEIALVDPLPRSASPTRRRAGAAPVPHVARARDDFYVILLAWQLDCGVLSADKFRDLKDMKSGQLPPFTVLRFGPRGSSSRDIINPSSVDRKRAAPPCRFEPAELLPLWWA